MKRTLKDGILLVKSNNEIFEKDIFKEACFTEKKTIAESFLKQIFTDPFRELMTEVNRHLTLPRIEYKSGYISHLIKVGWNHVLLTSH